MKDLAISLAQARYLKEAEETINLIESDFYQAEALIELAAVFIQSGFLKEANEKIEEILSMIEGSPFQQEILKKLALALGKTKLFSRSLFLWVSTVGGLLREINDFLLTLTELTEFEQVQPKLSRYFEGSHTDQGMGTFKLAGNSRTFLD